MARDHEKTRSVSLVIRARSSQATVRCYFIATTIACHQRRSLAMSSVGENEDKWYILLVEMYIGTADVSMGTLQNYLALS